MNKFSAERFFSMAAALRAFQLLIEKWEQDPNRYKLSQETVDYLSGQMDLMKLECGKIGLRQSEKSAERIKELMKVNQLLEPIKHALDGFRSLIQSEMEDALFFWVPPDRAEWYSKDAESILGQECCTRFKAVQREVEEAAKCYAVGRFTASAFHLTRATEAGVKALAKAINYVPPNDNWTLVFRQMGNEFKLPDAQRPMHWQTHGDFLEEIWADLRAVSKAWRNDIAHLVDTYTEDEAKGLLDVLPLFLRHLATKMDENGKLYP